MATSFFVSRLSLFKLFSLTLIEESWDVCNWFFSEVGATALESSDLLWSEVFALTPFEVVFVLGAVGATEPTSFFYVVYCIGFNWLATHADCYKT